MKTRTSKTDTGMILIESKTLFPFRGHVTVTPDEAKRLADQLTDTLTDEDVKAAFRY